MIVGVVADTHGRLHPAALESLLGAERILHAGDVGDAAILTLLGSVAPVTAIRGNVDRGGLAAALPDTELVELGGVAVYMLHDLKTLALDPVAAGAAAVVSGHTHVAEIAMRRGVLYVNPGSCGPRRFRLPITLARMTIEGGRVRAEIVTLAP